MAKNLGVARSKASPPVDAVALGTFYLVRHAKAGSRSHWTGDDRLRPLSKKGVKQAEELVSIFGTLPITAIYSSPFLRCVQTVEPLARARKLEVELSTALGEGQRLMGAMLFLGDAELDQVVLSCHGDLVWELVEDLVKRHVIGAGEGGFEKASTWVVTYRNDEPTQARFIPAP
jgi:phosphohistidine phosphatase SixA